jgi:hypothetical protein
MTAIKIVLVLFIASFVWAMYELKKHNAKQ